MKHILLITAAALLLSACSSGSKVPNAADPPAEVTEKTSAISSTEGSSSSNAPDKPIISVNDTITFPKSGIVCTSRKNVGLAYMYASQNEKEKFAQLFDAEHPLCVMVASDFKFNVVSADKDPNSPLISLEIKDADSGQPGSLWTTNINAKILSSR